MEESFGAHLAAVNRKELLFTAGAGVVGALIGYLPIAPFDYSYALGDYMSAPVEWYSLVTALFCGGCIGGFIVAAEGSPSTLTVHVKRRLLRGFFISLVFGFLAEFLGGVLFESILSALGGVRFGSHGEVVQGSLTSLPLLTLIFARASEWSLRGALVGLGIGIATLVWTKPLKGLLGGLVGGFVAGLTLDPITHGIHSRIIADLFGYLLQGLFLGLAIGLVYELTKTAWLIVDAGRLRGRQFRLDKAAAIIGRAEECEVGLFGDPSVATRHARIGRVNSAFEIVDLAQRGDLCINGRPALRSMLNDGDRISVGNYVLTFHARAKATSAGFQGHHGALGKEATFMSSRVPQNAWLINSNGQRNVVRAGGSLSIGREPDNSLVLDDNTVSRYHAIIETAGQGFRIRDLGSSNGTFLNERRIGDTGAVFANGDSVRFGALNFHFAHDLGAEEAKGGLHSFCTKCGGAMSLNAIECPSCGAPRLASRLRDEVVSTQGRSGQHVKADWSESPAMRSQESVSASRNASSPLLLQRPPYWKVLLGFALALPLGVAYRVAQDLKTQRQINNTIKVGWALTILAYLAFGAYLLNDSGDSATKHYNLGVDYMEKKQSGLAEQQFKIAIQKDPNLAEAHVNLANIYDQAGWYEGAEQEAKKGIDILERTHETEVEGSTWQQTLSRGYTMLGAAKAHDAAKRGDDDPLNALVELKEALNDFKKAVDLDSANAQAQADLDKFKNSPLLGSP